MGKNNHVRKGVKNVTLLLISNAFYHTLFTDLELENN